MNYISYKYTSGGTTFLAGVNSLPAIRAAIATQYPLLLPANREAALTSVFILSASAFTVQFCDGAIVGALLLPSGDYCVDYEGTISELIFTGLTVAKFFGVNWGVDRRNHVKLAFSDVVSNSTVTISDDWSSVYTPSADGTYELLPGWYTYTIEKENYNSISARVFIGEDKTITINQLAVEYIIAFDVTPEIASIVVTDADENIMTPISDGVYSLANSAVAGDYTYVISAPGYQTVTDTLTVSADASVVEVLTALSYTVTFTLTPATADFVLMDASEQEVTPTSSSGGVFTYDITDSRVAGVYNYTASAAGYITQTDEYSALGAGNTDIVLVEEA